MQSIRLNASGSSNEPPSLGPTTPVDEALLGVARMLRLRPEGAKAADLAQLLAHLAGSSQHIQARHIIFGLVVVAHTQRGEGLRAEHRQLCGQLLGALEQAGVAEMGTHQDAAIALQQWLVMQAKAAALMMRHPSERLLMLRDMLMMDAIDMSGELVALLEPQVSGGDAVAVSPCGTNGIQP